MPIPLLADEEIEGDEEENEIDPRMQNPQANHSHYERHRDDNPEDDKWYDEEDIGHLHEEPLQQNEDNENDSHMYQDDQDPNEAEDSQNEDSDINSPYIPQQYLNEV